MSIFVDFFVLLAKVIADLIAAMGYTGVFILMALESMIAPVPSELVMPFVGFLASRGTFNLWIAVFVSGIGSLFGSLLSYWIGRKYGRDFVLRYGKFLLIDSYHLQQTEKWFKHNGEKTIFIGRFIPVVRHLISVPAGIGKMNLGKFCAYTFAGAIIWNLILAVLGLWLGENWQVVHAYLEPITIAVALLLVAFIILFLLSKRKNNKTPEKAERKTAKWKSKKNA